MKSRPKVSSTARQKESTPSSPPPRSIGRCEGIDRSISRGEPQG
jgi:hypothetical protein